MACATASVVAFVPLTRLPTADPRPRPRPRPRPPPPQKRACPPPSAQLARVPHAPPRRPRPRPRPPPAPSSSPSPLLPSPPPSPSSLQNGPRTRRPPPAPLPSPSPLLPSPPPSPSPLQNRPRSRRPPPAAPASEHDLTLLARARAARKLASARSQLRKITGAEPPLHAALALARSTDASVSPEPRHWRAVFDARNALVVKWLWLVSAVATKLHRTYSSAFPHMRAVLCRADLVQEGVVGLMNAVEKYDPSRGYPFDSFAFYSIKHAILRAIENQSRPIRLPVHVLNKLSRMRSVRDDLVRRNLAVSVDAIARNAGVSKKAAELYLERSKHVVSIDEPVAQHNSSSNNTNTHRATPLRDFLVDHSVDVTRHVESACTREAVAELVNSAELLDLERSVLSLKYGLSDGVERMRAEVSRILDVRVQNVRRAELSALKKLRHTIGDDAAAWTELVP